MALKYKRKYGVTLDPDTEVIATIGSKEGFSHLCLAMLGPGDTIVLPEFTIPWMFMHEAELAIVIKGPAKMVKQANWRDAVFGYTTMIDVSARGNGRHTWPSGPPN